MSDIIMLAAGERCVCIAEQVRERAEKEGADFTLVNARFLKPLDEELLCSRPEKKVFVIEDNMKAGGLGDAVARFYAHSDKEIFSFGYCDKFIPHGEPLSLAKKYGLDPDTLLGEVLRCARR